MKFNIRALMKLILLHVWPKLYRFLVRGFFGGLIVLLIPVNAAESEKVSLDEKIEVLYQEVGTEPEKALNKTVQIRKAYADKLTAKNKVRLLEAESWAYAYTGDYQKALKILDKLELIAKQEKNDYFHWKMNNAKGMLHWEMEMGQESLKYHLKAYQYFKNDLNNPARFRTQNNIAYVSIQLGFYKEAIPYLESNLKHYLEFPSVFDLGIAYNNLGEAYFGLKEYDKALEHHLKSLEIRIANQLEFHASYSHHNLGLLYLSQKQFEKSEIELLKAIKIRKKTNFTKGMLASQLLLAEVYREKKDPNSLEIALNELVTDATNGKSLTVLANVFKMQRDLFKDKGLFEKALSASINYQQSIERVQIKKTNTHMAQYLTQSSTVTKDLNILELRKTNEIQTLKVKNEQQKNQIILIAGVIIVFSLSTFLWLIQQKRKKIQVANKNLSLTLTELKATQKCLIESEKMSALSTLVSGMAHQMNTPLGVGITTVSHIKSSIENFIRLATSGKLKKSEIGKLVKGLNQGSELALKNMNRAADLVSQFKAISSQLEDNTLKEFRLVEFLKQRSDMIVGSIQADKPNIKIHGNEVDIVGYLNALGKVISHLIQNSIDHAFKDTSSPLIDIQVQKQEQLVEIIYRDNGTGIDDQLATKIFDPFFTTNMGNKNVGIGLSIVYNLIVQLMQGTILCEPTMSNGSSFRITLPIKCVEAQT